MKKVLFVATVVKTHIMEFHLPYLEMFKEMGWETAVASRNDYENPADCNIPFCDTYYDIPFARFPLKPSNIKAYRALKKVIDEGEYDIIHCHTPVGALLARLAARKARKRGTKVIYTAHGFHFFKGAPLINWLVYYPVERFTARYTDVLITINGEDYKRAEKFSAKKVCYVPGVGINMEKFRVSETARVEKRRELVLGDEDFVMLSVGELIARKNHAMVLKALAELKDSPCYERLQYLVCGRGELDGELKQLAEQLGVADRVRFLGYRSDVQEICNCSDLFVFMSWQEGLPVALMEAMACGLPVVCSRIRGNTDLIEDGVSGRIVDFEPEAIAGAIKQLLNEPETRAAYAKAARAHLEMFELESVKSQVRKIYEDVVSDRR